MPYVYDPNQDPNNPNNPQMGSGGQQLASGSQVSGGGLASGGGGSVNAKPTQSGTFQNLNDYLQANQGSGFGGQFSNKVNEDVNKAGQAQDSGAYQFKNAADQGSTKYNSDLVNRAVTDPYGFSQNQQDVNTFKAQKDASYKGPTNFSDVQSGYNQAAGATQKAKNVASQAQTEPGRFALLNNYFGKPQYSQGQKSLDNLLVQGDATAQQGIQQARQNAQTAQQNFGKLNTELSNYGAQARGNTEAARSQTRGALGLDAAGNYVQGQGAIGQAQSDISNRQAQLTSQAQADYQAARNALAANQTLTPEMAQRLGVNANEEFYGIDPTQYLSQGQNPNFSTAANADQRARLQALTQLSDLNGLNGFDPNAASYDPNSAYALDSGNLRTQAEGRHADLNNLLGSWVHQAPGDGRSVSQIVNDPNMTLEQKMAQFQRDTAGYSGGDGTGTSHSSLQQILDSLGQEDPNLMTQQNARAYGDLVNQYYNLKQKY